MRWLACVLVAALLPGRSVLQTADVLDNNTKQWLKHILPDNQLDYRFEAESKSGTNINNNTVDNSTVDWLLTILKKPDGETSTSSPVANTTSSVQNKFDTDPELDEFQENRVCQTEDGADGICVSYFQCDKGLVDNTTLIDLRDGSCPHYLHKCCLRSESTKKPKLVPTTSAECGWNNPGAGILRINDEGNINRRTYADYGEFPWMVALIKKEQDENNWSQLNYLGGGSIIHPSVVITAAHKVDRYLPSEIKCRAGEWDTQTILEQYPHQERDVSNVITHEEYYRTPAYNDVSLLMLSAPFALEDAPQIGVACLAPQPPPPGTQCYSMGWGKEFQDKNKNAVILKKVKLPFIASDKCEEALKKSRLTSRFRLHASLLCAGGEVGTDTCKGDGGSPLVCPIKQGPDTVRFAVYGMVAFGVGCGSEAPGVYVNVPHLYAWVDNKMAAEGFGGSSYKY